MADSKAALHGLKVLEWQIPIYDQLGDIPQRIGNGISGAPSSVVHVFRSADGKWITVTSGTVRSIQNIASLVGKPLEDYETPP